MHDLGTYEVWFVTGSQHLYGPETLETVAATPRGRGGARRGAGDPGPGGREAGRDRRRRHPRAVPGGQRDPGLHRRHRLDAHVLAGQDVDRRAHGPAAAAPPPAHPAPRRDPVGRHRHGLHEPQPGRPRRPGVRVHGRPPAIEHKVVAGHWTTTEVHERVGAWTRAAAAKRDWETGRIARFGDNMRDVAVTEGDKVEATAPARLPGRHLRGRRPRRGHRREQRRRGRRPRRDVPRRVRRRPGPASRCRRAPSRCATGPGSRSACAGSSTPAGSRVHHDLRGPPRHDPAAGPRGPAADARRLRLRRRGRLEDRGDGARDEGHVERAAGRRLVHGGLHVSHDPRRGPQPRGAHARGLRVDRRAAGRVSRSTRSGSAARPTRSGSCSTRTRARRSRPRSWTWARASAWSRPSST